MLQEFKQFILRGNIIDLAVGITVGAAFTSVVNALVKDLMTPFISAIAKTPDFSSLNFVINHSKFLYGDFLNALISFLIISTTVYFLIVFPVNTLTVRMRKAKGAPPAPATKKCPECFTDIPKEAKRCPNCTTKIN